MIRIPLQFLRIGPNVVAGANLLVVASLAYLLRSTTDDPEPALVRQLRPDDYSITDGRHRFLAAVIAGRPDLLCEVEA